MEKKAYFYVDDVIWPFRDITREHPKSIFDQLLLKTLKEAHDRYGLKVTLNTFFRTDYFYGDDEFSLSEMTDAYKKEWEENADWLKIGFHAKQEFPDYPFVNAEYTEMKNQLMRFKNEVLRFAGEKIFSDAMNPHWYAMSREGVCAVKDCDIKIMSVTVGEKSEYHWDRVSLPYGHARRILNHRKPEAGVCIRKSRDGESTYSVCGYNHISTEEAQRIQYTHKMLHDKETAMLFKPFADFYLNTVAVKEIEKNMEKATGHPFICVGTHEQYSYPDYFAYQADSREKLMKMCAILEKNGYTYTFIEDMAEQN